MVADDRTGAAAADAVVMMVMTWFLSFLFLCGYPAAGDAAVVVAKVVAGAAPPAGSGAAPVMSVTCQRPAVIRNVIEYPARWTPPSAGGPVHPDLRGDQVTVPVALRVAAGHHDLGAVHHRRGDLALHPRPGRGRCVPGQDEIQLHRIGDRPRPQERHQHAAGQRLGDRRIRDRWRGGCGRRRGRRDRNHGDIADHPHTGRIAVVEDTQIGRAAPTVRPSAVVTTKPSCAAAPSAYTPCTGLTVPSQVTASGAFDGVDPVHPHPGVTPAEVIRASAASRSAVAVVSAASGCVQHNDR